MTQGGNDPAKNPSGAAESMPESAESAGRPALTDGQDNSSLQSFKSSNGIHSINAVASSSKLTDVRSEPVSSVALGKRKWVESELLADSNREIELSLQLDYLATQYPEQRLPPPDLHPPGFVHYDVPLRDVWSATTGPSSPAKPEVKLEEEGEQRSKNPVNDVKPAEGPPPFRDAEDAVERLLPWHVWQIWDEDLDYKPLSETARRSAEMLPQEQTKRWADICKRYRVARERDAKNTSPIPSVLQLHPSLSQQLRAEIMPLQQKLRTDRAELDGILRAKKEQEDRQRRIREETERREREAKRIEDLRRGSGAAGSAAPSRAGSGPSTPGLTSAPGTPAGTPKGQAPVIVNLPATYLPQAFKIGLLALPGGPTPAVKPPATVVRTADEQKVTLTVDLGRCSQAHIAFLAKCLNIQPAASNTAGAAAAGNAPRPSTPAASAPPTPSKAAPPK